MSQKLLQALGLVALIMAVGKILRFRAWKMAHRRWAVAGGPEDGFRARYWHRPPWFRHWEKWHAEEPEDAEPDAETETARAENASA